MDHAEGHRRINEGERGGCGERIATILEHSSNGIHSTVDTMTVSMCQLKKRQIKEITEAFLITVLIKFDTEGCTGAN